MIDRYLENQVMTASPQRLHLMVVDGAVRHANRALEAIETSNWETMHLELNTALDFVAEIIGGLDETQAPELVRSLKGLFAFVIRNLMYADMERSAQRLQDAISILKSHRETWLELLESLQESNAAALPDGGSLSLSS